MHSAIALGFTRSLSNADLEQIDSKKQRTTMTSLAMIPEARGLPPVVQKSSILALIQRRIETINEQPAVKEFGKTDQQFY